jgi:UDP-N-acetylmuramate dehydrogenase
MSINFPEVRGRVSKNVSLKKTNWFQVGGEAQILFKPADLEDLLKFLREKPDCEITILGVGSNIVVRDGGIDGVVIKLGREFASITHAGEKIICGAAALDVNVAHYCQLNSLTGLEFLSGIPGTIGGALAMNGGAYGSETADILLEAQAIDLDGNLLKLSPKQLKYSYRKCGLLAEKPLIFTNAVLQAKAGNVQEISTKISQIKSEREASQPVRSRTGGSTFKNPQNAKAWKLIDEAGCRGLKIGGAQMSEMHCNFVINNGEACAADIENLVLEVQKHVHENSGILLEPELKFLGKFC